MGWYRGLKGATISVPGTGFVVFNKGSVKALPDEIAERMRFVERGILEPMDEDAAKAAVADALRDAKPVSAAKAARERARQRQALKQGVDLSETRSPTKARAQRVKARKAAAAGGSPADAPVD